MAWDSVVWCAVRGPVAVLCALVRAGAPVAIQRSVPFRFAFQPRSSELLQLPCVFRPGALSVVLYRRE